MPEDSRCSRRWPGCEGGRLVGVLAHSDAVRQLWAARPLACCQSSRHWSPRRSGGLSYNAPSRKPYRIGLSNRPPGEPFYGKTRWIWRAKIPVVRAHRKDAWAFVLDLRRRIPGASFEPRITARPWALGAKEALARLCRWPRSHELKGAQSAQPSEAQRGELRRHVVPRRLLSAPSVMRRASMKKRWLYRWVRNNISSLGMHVFLGTCCGST